MPWPMLLRPAQLSALPAWPSHLRRQVGSPCQPLRSWINRSPHVVCQHGLTPCLWRVGPQPSHTPFSPCATRFRWHVGPTQPCRSSCNGLSVAPPHVMQFYRWPNRLRWGKGGGAITRRVEHQTSAYPLPAELQSSPKGSTRFEGGESVPLSSGVNPMIHRHPCPRGKDWSIVQSSGTDTLWWECTEALCDAAISRHRPPFHRGAARAMAKPYDHTPIGKTTPI